MKESQNGDERNLKIRLNEIFMRNLFGRLISYLMVIFSGLIFVNAIRSEHFSFNRMPKSMLTISKKIVFIWIVLFSIGGLLSLYLEKVVIFLKRSQKFFSEEIIILIGHGLFGLGILFQILCITLQPGMA